MRRGFFMPGGRDVCECTCANPEPINVVVTPEFVREVIKAIRREVRLGGGDVRRVLGR